MLTAFALLLLAQTSPAIRRSTPASDDPGMVVRQTGTVSVNCTNCGNIFAPDGGNIGSVTQGLGLDGGTGWGVFIEGGNLSVSSSVAFDGGFIGSVGQGVGQDGGEWNTSINHVVSVVVLDGGGSSTITQGPGQDGGAWNVSVNNFPATWYPDGGFIGVVTALGDGGVTAYQGGTWNVGVTGSVAVTGPLTDAQLRATPVPVSGTVTANAGSGPWPVTDNGGSLTVDGTVAATQSGTWNVTNISGTVSLPTGAATETTLSTRLADSTFTGRFAAPASLVDATANPSVTGIGTYLMGYNGTTWDRLRKSASGLLVDIQNTSLAVTQSGTWNVGLSSGTNYVGKTRITDGTLDVSLLNSAPGSDTGQVSVPVRIISSLAGGAGGTSSSYGAAFPASGTAAGFSDGTNMESARVFDADTGGGTQNVLGVVLRNPASGGSAAFSTGSGTVDANTLRVVLPTNQPNLTVQGTVSASITGGTIDTVTTITDPVTVTGTVTADTELPAANALADSTVNPTTTSVGALGMMYNGATWDRIRGTTANGLLVNISNTGLASSSSFGSAFPSTGTAAGFTDGTNMRAARVYDLDTTGSTDYVQGMSLRASSAVGGSEAAFGAGTTSAATLRVVLPTDQTSIPVAAGQSGAWNVGQTGTWNINNVSGTVSLPTGAATEATLGTLLLNSTFTGRFAAGALLSDNFANPTTTGVGAFGMLWDGTTWDRTPGNSTDGVLVNLGANNDVTVTSGTVTANAGTGTFTVGQSTAANLRTQTSAEGATGSAVPANAVQVGYTDGTNLRAPKVFDTDTSGAAEYTAGSVLVTSNSGGAQQVTGRGTSDGYNGISVHMLYKATSTITNTAVSCAGTATAMPASVQSNRSTITVYNNGSQTVYIGNATVTTATGIPLPPGGYWVDDVRVAAYYCIVASGSAEVRVMEQ